MRKVVKKILMALVLVGGLSVASMAAAADRIRRSRRRKKTAGDQSGRQKQSAAEQDGDKRKENQSRRGLQILKRKTTSNWLKHRNRDQEKAVVLIDSRFFALTERSDTGTGPRTAEKRFTRWKSRASRRVSFPGPICFIFSAIPQI